MPNETETLANIVLEVSCLYAWSVGQSSLILHSISKIRVWIIRAANLHSNIKYCTQRNVRHIRVEIRSNCWCLSRWLHKGGSVMVRAFKIMKFRTGSQGPPNNSGGPCALNDSNIVPWKGVPFISMITQHYIQQDLWQNCLINMKVKLNTSHGLQSQQI